MLWWTRSAPTKASYSSINNDKLSTDSLVSSYHDDMIDSELAINILPTKRSQNYETIIIIVLSLVLIAETGLLLVQYPIEKATAVPHFALETKVFQRESDWEFSDHAHDLWNGVIPNSGLVAIRNPHQYDLEDGLKTSTPDSQVYGVVVTHEYHCLKMIRENFVGLVTRDPEYMDLLFAPNTSITLPDGRLNHMFHCIDYLRQTILCRADTTLEWRSDVNEKHIDGYGPPHQCRNWDEVYGWMQEHLPEDRKYHQQQKGDT